MRIRNSLPTRRAFYDAYILTFIIIVALTAPVLVHGLPEISNDEKALQYVSQIYGIPKERLIIVNEGNVVLPDTERRLWRAKIMDLASGETYGVYIDEASGEIVDIGMVKAEEAAEYYKRYGKLERELFERLQVMGDGELMNVSIWLTWVDGSVPRPMEADSEEEYNRRVALMKDVIAIKQKPVIDYLNASGFEVKYASQYAPLLFAKLPKGIINQLQNLSDVSMIYLSRTYEPMLDSAAKTIRAPKVWDQEINGAGVNIAVVDAGGIVGTWGGQTQPYLLAPRYYSETYYAYTPEDNEHATAIAGIIASTHTTYRGIAHGADGMLSANWGWPSEDMYIIDATEWAIKNGANIFNFSWGRDTDLKIDAIATFFDYVVWHYGKTVAVSAGNNNSPTMGTGTGNVGSPGLAYNVITVGAIDDQDTETWSDDVMAGYSSWREATSGDREKPEVVAVGSAKTGNYNTDSNTWMYSTLTAPPWVGMVGAGTSFAAPAVVGEAALLMDWSRSFKIRSHLVKAIIMASAVHNVEGNSRLSEYDGAGSVDTWTAYETVDNGRFQEWSASSKADFPKTKTFSASVGQRVRVAISWFSHPPSKTGTSDPLESDLDLDIYDPDGILIDLSNSWDNNYEIVDFLAPKSGTYTAKINAYRFDGRSEKVGLAFSLMPSVIKNPSFEQRAYLPQPGGAYKVSSWSTPDGGWRDLRGDVNGDATANTFDLLIVRDALVSQPGDPNWNPDADINGDGMVDVFDLLIVRDDLGKIATRLDGAYSWYTNASGGTYVMNQSITGFDVESLKGNTVTFKFWFYPAELPCTAYASIWYEDESGTHAVYGAQVTPTKMEWRSAFVQTTLPVTADTVALRIHGENLKAWVDSASLSIET